MRNVPAVPKKNTPGGRPRAWKQNVQVATAQVKAQETK